MKDLHDNIDVRRVISPTRVTDNTAQVGQIINHAGYESAEYIVNTGTLADVDMTVTALLEESDDPAMAGAVAVAAADRLGSLPSFIFSDDDKVFKCGYKGSKQYTRLTLTPALNTGNADISAVCVLSHARHAPAGATQTP